MTIHIDQIIRTKRKTVSLVVDADGRLTVRAPMKTPQAFIDDFVLRKSGWIEEKQQMMAERKARHSPIGFVAGEHLPFLGETYRLAVSPQSGYIAVRDGELHVPAGLADYRQAIVAWYYAQARVIFTERAHLYAEQYCFSFQALKISDAQGRWGSCSRKGNINLSWRLVMCPLPVIDYVVVHELAHLKHLNHSPAFWGVVKGILPDYKQHRKWLRDNSEIINLI